jgi:hypothetical protein
MTVIRFLWRWRRIKWPAAWRVELLWFWDLLELLFG